MRTSKPKTPPSAQTHSLPENGGFAILTLLTLNAICTSVLANADQLQVFATERVPMAVLPVDLAILLSTVLAPATTGILGYILVPRGLFQKREKNAATGVVEPNS